MVAVRGSAALRGRWISVDTTSTGFGYHQVRGLTAPLATLTALVGGAGDRGARTPGGCYSARGGNGWSPTPSRLLVAGMPVLVQMGSASYGRNPVHAASPGVRRCRSPPG